MTDTVVLFETDAGRMTALRGAIERRGLAVAAEAASPAEVLTALASLEQAPAAVLVGARVPLARSVARIVKRVLPATPVLLESDQPALLAMASGA